MSNPGGKAFLTALARQCHRRYGSRRLLSLALRCEIEGKWARNRTYPAGFDFGFISASGTKYKFPKEEIGHKIEKMHRRIMHSDLVPIKANSELKVSELQSLLTAELHNKTPTELEEFALKWVENPEPLVTVPNVARK